MEKRRRVARFSCDKKSAALKKKERDKCAYCNSRSEAVVKVVKTEAFDGPRRFLEVETKREGKNPD